MVGSARWNGREEGRERKNKGAGRGREEGTQASHKQCEQFIERPAPSRSPFLPRSPLLPCLLLSSPPRSLTFLIFAPRPPAMESGSVRFVSELRMEDAALVAGAALA